jgi:hypothetical protein
MKQENDKPSAQRESEISCCCFFLPVKRRLPIGVEVCAKTVEGMKRKLFI